MGRVRLGASLTAQSAASDDWPLTREGETSKEQRNEVGTGTVSMTKSINWSLTPRLRGDNRAEAVAADTSLSESPGVRPEEHLHLIPNTTSRVAR